MNQWKACFKQKARFIDAIFDQAKHWLSLRQTALRTLDALHLACAQSVDAKLITADEKLSQAARAFRVFCLSAGSI